MRQLLLAIVFSAQSASAIAHEGHGLVDPATVVHLFLDHGGLVLLLAAAAVVAVLAGKSLRRTR